MSLRQFKFNFSYFYLPVLMFFQLFLLFPRNYTNCNTFRWSQWV